jgi:hypothetical protein
MPEIEIIGVPQSNYVWCCRIACAEKGVPHKLIEVRPFSPEAEATHPFEYLLIRKRIVHQNRVVAFGAR